MAKRETEIRFKMWVPLKKDGSVYISDTQVKRRRKPTIWDSQVDRMVWADVTIMPAVVQQKKPKPKKGGKRGKA